MTVNNLQNLECCLVVLFPYFSYMLAESVGLSGIVAILFCGVVMKHYMFPNLSINAQALTSSFFQLISSLAETFVFIYMGLDIAIEDQSWSHVGFIFFSIIFMVVARAANVFPCAYLVNLIRPLSRQIPLKHQKALCFSGLRGAMAFALALQSTHDLPEGHGRTIFTATTAIVVLTVLLIGGSTSTMLEALEVTGENNIGETPDEENEYLAPAFVADNDGSPTQNLKTRLRQFQQSTTSFTAFDKNFLTPFFTASSGQGLPLLDGNDVPGEGSGNVEKTSYMPHNKREGRGSFSVSTRSGHQDGDGSSEGRLRRLPSNNAHNESIRQHVERAASKDQSEPELATRSTSLETPRPRQARGG
ncbi:hypothetical protein L7F22_001218 [Adiantum nelumboides]|nr:hypothetical protein [Adiantum nelumboides]